MPCNAHNHAKDCGFGGQPGTSRPDAPSPAMRWRAALARRRMSCPHCGKGVYFVRGRHGGTFYLNEILPGWSSKHECAALRRTSRPRVAMSEWRRAGWLPLGVLSATESDLGQIVDAVSLIDDGRFRFRLVQGSPLSADAPAFYRLVDPLLGMLEVDYLSDETGELVGSVALGEKLPD